MIYGKGCKGNYNRMEKFALKSPVFPSITNKRDMIYIGNLVDYLKYIIDNGVSGILYPKDPQLICTAEMVKLIAKANGHSIHLWGVFNPFVKLFMTDRNIFALVFGDNYCDIKDPFEWKAPYDLNASINEIYR
jgi:UDP-glucose 4-epimerase